MNLSAHVTSLNAIVDFRSGLCTFTEEVRNALTEIDMEIRRTVDWLGDQQRGWKEELREAEDDVIRARSELARRKMARVGDRPVDTTEQEKNLARARYRQECAQEKLAAVKHWLTVLPEEIREYDTPARLLQDTVESDLPRVVAMLEGKIAALEAYAASSPPPE